MPDVWTAAQFDRPSENDGIIQVFRRDKSPFTSASFKLFAVDENAEYEFCDIDDNSEFTISGNTLKKTGFCISLDKKCTAKVFIYRERY